jgi:hypothetical protein
MALTHDRRGLGQKGTDSASPAGAGLAVEAIRWFTVLLFAGGGVWHLLVTARRPELYEDFAKLAVVPPYEWLLHDVIRPHATPFTLLLAAFELSVAALVSRRGRAQRLGLAGAIAFELALIPGCGAYGLVNLPLAAAQAAVPRTERARHPRTASPDTAPRGNHPD